MNESLPIAVIGAGPVGLAAAAHLLLRGLEPVVFERASTIGAAPLAWGHVRLFSPWRYNIDTAARALLEASGWRAPDADVIPTGRELVEQYLQPLATLPALASRIRTSSAVTAITRDGLDKLSSGNRADTAFLVRITDQAEQVQDIRVRAVIDASGTWGSPNPIGVNGLAVAGEAEAANFIDYDLPDVAGARRADFSGKRALVIGGGHSAINVVLDLLSLQDHAPQTTVHWALRRDTISRLLGGGLNDQLPARGALGLAAKKAIDAGRLHLLAPFSAERITAGDSRLTVEARLAGKAHQLDVDRIVVATGLRPDLGFLRELRLSLDPIVEAPSALAPLIDPNLHSCGTVPPHGVVELTHPEPGFYIAGMKSYGRAPTFLMATGYEQVRSIAAELAGDFAAAHDVHLVLPETGVCSSDAIDGGALEASTCCGGPAPDTIDACCRKDAEVKAAGGRGCGCASSAGAETENRESIKA